MQPTLALFDFDGTLTNKDSFLAFIKFSKGSAAFYVGLLWLGPAILSMKLGLISRKRLKEKFLIHFFGGMHQEQFERLANNFCKSQLPGIIRNSALAKLLQHYNNGHKVFIVTASAENWVRPWAQMNHCEVIGTLLQTSENRITGTIKGENCNFGEKVNRIQKKLNLAEYITIYVYGDSAGDYEMMKLATHAYFKLFRD